MKKLLINTIKKITNKLGYKILKTEKYNHLIVNKRGVKPNAYDKNNLLESFFSLLINQNYYPETIYDIGANKGTWTKECLKYFPNSTYYLFEPQTELKKDIKSNLGDLMNVNLFSVGVGDINDDLNFTIHKRDDGCSYSYTEEEADKLNFKQIVLPIVRLETFVKDKNLKKPSLLKIDAEGFDLKVLDGASSLFESIEIIMVEVGIMNDRIQNSALEMLNYLDVKGYKLFDITDINRPFSNKALWLCEFVFIKKSGVLDLNYLEG